MRIWSSEFQSFQWSRVHAYLQNFIFRASKIPENWKFPLSFLELKICSSEFQRLQRIDNFFSIVKLYIILKFLHSTFILIFSILFLEFRIYQRIRNFLWTVENLVFRISSLELRRFQRIESFPWFCFSGEFALKNIKDSKELRISFKVFFSFLKLYIILKVLHSTFILIFCILFWEFRRYQRIENLLSKILKIP